MRSLAVLGIPAALVVLFGAFGLDFGLPHQIQERDERLVVTAAAGIFTGDWNPHLFRYPAAFIYLVHAALVPIAAWWRATGAVADPAQVIARFEADGTAFTIAARALALAASAGAAALAAAVAWRLGGAAAGLAAGVILALAPLSAEMSRFARVDAAMALCVVAALFFATRLRAEGRVRDAALAGVCAGLAAATKYPAVFVLPAVWCAALLAPRRADGRRPISLARGALLLGALPAAVFLAASPFIVLDFASFLGEMRGIARLVAVPFQHDRPASGPFFYPRQILGPSFGAGFFALAVAGLVAMLRSRGQPAIHLLAFGAPYMAFFTLARTAYDRFLLPVLPVLAILAGVGAVRLARRLRMPAALVVLIAFAPTAPHLAGRVIAGATNGDTRLRALPFLEERVPSDSWIIVDDDKRKPPLARRGAPARGRPQYRIFTLPPSGEGAAAAARNIKPAAIVLSDLDPKDVPSDLLPQYAVAASFQPGWRCDGPRLVVLFPAAAAGAGDDPLSAPETRVIPSTDSQADPPVD
jgi:hypothetical protein